MIISQVRGVWEADLKIYFMTYPSKPVDEKKKTDPSGAGDNKAQNSNSVWVWQVVFDILGNMSVYSFMVILFLSLFFTYIWGLYDYCELQVSELCKDFITVYSCLLGFIITGYSIILTLHRSIVEVLSKHVDVSFNCSFLDKFHKKCCKKRNPYDILCASFSLCCILLMITILLLILYRNQNSSLDSNDCFFWAVRFFICISFFSVLDIIFHLYSISTFINKNHNKVSFKGTLSCHKKKQDVD